MFKSSSTPSGSSSGEPRPDFGRESLQGLHDILMGKIADMEHAHEMTGADPLHLLSDLLDDSPRTARNDVTAGQQLFPRQAGEVDAGPVLFAEVAKRPRGVQRGV